MSKEKIIHNKKNQLIKKIISKPKKFTKNNNQKQEFIKTCIKNLSAWNQLEYIYMDETIKKYNNLPENLKEKIVITNDGTNFKMYDFTLNDEDILNYTQKVELIITHDLPEFIPQISDIHTIIIRIINENFLYLKDNFKGYQVIFKDDDIISIKNNTLTKIHYQPQSHT